MFANLEIGSWLLDDPGHESLRVGHDHAEALIVLDLLGPDDAIGIEPIDQGQIRLEHRVDEDDQDRSVHEWAGEIHGTRRPVLDLLLDEARGILVARPSVRFDLLLEMAGDENQLFHVQARQPVHDPIHHRSPGHLEERLRHEIRVGPEAGALARERNDDLHDQPRP